MLKGYGFALQYSVFLCDLDATEKTGLFEDLQSVLHLRFDSVVLVDLGDVRRIAARRFEFMGVRPALPSSDATIV